MFCVKTYLTEQQSIKIFDGVQDSDCARPLSDPGAGRR